MHSLAPEDRGVAYAEAAVAQVCHMLAGPLGTLAAVIELARGGSVPSDVALEMLIEPSRSLCERLDLVRAAWAGDCPPMTAERCAELAALQPRPCRVTIDAPDGSLDGPIARLVLNLAMMASAAQPTGGKLRITSRPGCVAARLEDGHGWTGPVVTDEPDARPRDVQAAFVQDLARQLGVKVVLISGG